MKEYTKQQCENKIAKWQKRLDNLNKGLEVGKWYKYKNNHANALMRYSKGSDTYGFWRGKYRHDLSFNATTDKTEVSIEDVKQMFINEAKKRGFVEGATFKSVYYGSKRTIKNPELNFEHFNYDYADSIYIDNTLIFKNGKWAEIIKEPIYEYQWLADTLCGVKKVTVAFYTEEEVKDFIFFKPIKKIKETKRLKE